MRDAPRSRFALAAITLTACLVVALVAAACSSSSVAPAEPDEQPTLSPEEIAAASTDAPADASGAADGERIQTEVEPTPTPDRPRITIGVAMAETGVLAQFDRPALVGMQWQAEQINARGGLLGRELVLDVRDTQSRMSITEQVAEELLDAGAAALFVTCDADFARPAIDLANERAIVSISPCGQDLEWDVLGFGPLSFTFGHSSFIEGFVMADRAAQKGWLTAAVFVDPTTPQTVDQCRGFQERFETIGGSVLASYEARFDLLDELDEQLDEQPVPAVGAVVLCTHMPGGLAGGPAIIDLIRDRGVMTPLVVGSTLDAPGLLRSTINPGQITIVTPSSVFGDDPNLNTNAMVDGIGDQTGFGVRGWTISGANAIEAFARALERTGELQGILIAQQMEAGSGQTLVGGTVGFTSTRHMQPARDFRVLESVADSARFVTVLSPPTAAG